MKVKATRRYVDRYNKNIVEEGTEFEVSDERAKELLEQKAVKILNEKQGKKDTSKPEVAPVQPEG